MRIRQYIESNYKSVFFNGKTIRMKIDNSSPILSIPTPEIEDVAINNRCLANCHYCYTSAVKTGKNFYNIVEKADKVWGSLPIEDRPFQIAIGGAGESTMHPDWIEFVTKVKSLGIVPNYTTNGMHLSDNILRTTEEVCGGVAVSWHPHIEKVFHGAMDKLSKIKTKLNVHLIVGEDGSLEQMQKIYDKYQNIVDYFVVLPYMPVGRAKFVDTNDVWIKSFEWINTVNQKQFAFGALFYEWLLKNETGLQMSIYEPEIFSGYRVMDDNYMNLYKSSYDLTLKNKINEKGIICI